MMKADVRAVVTVGEEERRLSMVTQMCEPIDALSYRDEKAIAAALRRLADELEHGTSFEGIQPPLRWLP